MIEQYESDRFCRKCQTWKAAALFPVRVDRKCGRGSHCIACRAAYNTEYCRKRRSGMPRGPESGHGAVTPLPSMDDMQRMECVNFRAWRGPVDFNRPLRATIGGGYV